MMHAGKKILKFKTVVIYLFTLVRESLGVKSEPIAEKSFPFFLS